MVCVEFTISSVMKQSCEPTRMITRALHCIYIGNWVKYVVCLSDS